MTIGIIGAMEVEVQLLRDHLKNRQDTHLHGFSFHQGEIGKHRVVVLLSGIGKVSASVGTALLIHHFSPEMIINTGTAGGLKDTHIYDLILASEVRHHDVDVTAFGYQMGQQAGQPPAFLPDMEQVSFIKNHFSEKFHIREGLVVSGDAFISDPNRKAWIQNHFPNALAVEMEAAAIAQTCHLMKTPFIILRAISDNAGQGDAVEYQTFVQKAGATSAQFNIDFINAID